MRNTRKIISLKRNVIERENSRHERQCSYAVDHVNTD